MMHSQKTAAWVTIFLLATLSTLAILWFEHTRSIAELLTFDTGVHVCRAIRVRNLLLDRVPADHADKKLAWAVLMGPPNKLTNMEGNIYPPGVSVLCGAALAWANDPSIAGNVRIATAVTAGFFFLLIVSVGGFTLPLGPRCSIFATLAVAASPLAISCSSQLLLDIPLAAMVAFTFWMLSACNDFRSRTYSILLGLAIGCGSLMKPTYWCFVALPIALALLPTAKDAFSSWKSRVLLALTASAGIGAILYWARHINLMLPAEPNTDAHYLSLMGEALGYTVLAIVLVYFINRRNVESPLTGLSDASPLQRFTNGCLAILVASLFFAPWYFPMMTSLHLNFYCNNPVEASGYHNIGPAFLYYAKAIAMDHFLLPYVFILPIGLFVGLKRRELRWNTILVIAAMVSSFIWLGCFGGRLSRYTLPQLLPLGWMLGCALASTSAWLWVQRALLLVAATLYGLVSFGYVYTDGVGSIPRSYCYEIWGDSTNGNPRSLWCLSLFRLSNRLVCSDNLPDNLFHLTVANCTKRTRYIYYSSLVNRGGLHAGFLKIGIELGAGSPKAVHYQKCEIIELHADMPISESQIQCDLATEAVVVHAEEQPPIHVAPFFTMVEKYNVQTTTSHSVEQHNWFYTVYTADPKTKKSQSM